MVAAHWPAFRERAEAQGTGLPRFVTREVDAYLRCGLLEHGFAELACARYGSRLLVAFSCKRRGFCPSCTGRRMADVAAQLVEHVLSAVPVRQWVCTLPWRFRVPVGYDRRLCADVLRAFLTALQSSLRRRAKATLGLRRVADAQTDAVTFLQRSDGALRLHPRSTRSPKQPGEPSAPRLDAAPRPFAAPSRARESNGVPSARRHTGRPHRDADPSTRTVHRAAPRRARPRPVQRGKEHERGGG